jgi:hypothetical protein
MKNEGEVTLENAGKHYGATYTTSKGMLHVKTHTETRSLQLRGQDPDELARRVLAEIVSAQPKP